MQFTLPFIRLVAVSSSESLSVFRERSEKQCTEAAVEAPCPRPPTYPTCSSGAHLALPWAATSATIVVPVAPAHPCAQPAHVNTRDPWPYLRQPGALALWRAVEYSPLGTPASARHALECTDAH